MKYMHIVSRRKVLGRLSAVLAGLYAAPLIGKESGDTAIAAADSDLVYITALSKDGQLGRCQAEVWFVPQERGFWIVTAADSWRARAAAVGGQVNIWVGDVGRWQDAKGAYRELPQLQASARIERDAAVHEQALTRFGAKYPMSWMVWGPRFKDGLADGSRVLIHYQPSV